MVALRIDNKVLEKLPHSDFRVVQRWPVRAWIRLSCLEEAREW